jgi:hypothetical protein
MGIYKIQVCSRCVQGFENRVLSFKYFEMYRYEQVYWRSWKLISRWLEEPVDIEWSD